MAKQSRFIFEPDPPANSGGPRKPKKFLFVPDEEPFALDRKPTVPDIAPVATPQATMGERVSDLSFDVAKGVLDIGPAVVGAADLAMTPARAITDYFSPGSKAPTLGGLMKDYLGYSPKALDPFFETGYSAERQAENRGVAQEDTYLGKLGALWKNPAVVLGDITRSVPIMLAGGVAGGAIAGKGAATAGSIGEGAFMAGGQASSTIDETGTLDPRQAALAGITGIAGTLIGRATGKLADRLGFADVDTMIAAAATDKAVRRQVVGLQREIAKIPMAALSEAAEEGGQTYIETASTNLAQGKKWDEGMGAAMASAMVSGGVMGAGAQAASTRRAPRPLVEPADAAAGLPVSAQAVAGATAVEQAVVAADPAGETLIRDTPTPPLAPPGTLSPGPTIGQRLNLMDLGYTSAQIAEMKPEEAAQVIAEGLTAAPSPTAPPIAPIEPVAELPAEIPEIPSLPPDIDEAPLEAVGEALPLPTPPEAIPETPAPPVVPPVEAPVPDAPIPAAPAVAGSPEAIIAAIGNVAKSEVIDGVLYTIDTKGSVRVVDVDTGSLVTKVNYPTPEAAEKGYAEAISGATKASEPPVVEPETPAVEPVPVTKVPRGTEKTWTSVGRNAEGVEIFEDQGGVRSYVRDGIRVTEPVLLIPTREGMTYGVDRTRPERRRDWETVEPVAAAPTETPAAPKAYADMTPEEKAAALTAKMEAKRAAKEGKKAEPAPEPEPVAAPAAVAPYVPNPMTSAERDRWSALIKKENKGKITDDEKAELKTLTGRGTDDAYFAFLNSKSNEQLQQARRSNLSPTNKSRQAGLPVVDRDLSMIDAIMAHRGIKPEVEGAQEPTGPLTEMDQRRLATLRAYESKEQITDAEKVELAQLAEREAITPAPKKPKTPQPAPKAGDIDIERLADEPWSFTPEEYTAAFEAGKLRVSTSDGRLITPDSKGWAYHVDAKHQAHVAKAVADGIDVPINVLEAYRHLIGPSAPPVISNNDKELRRVLRERFGKPKTPQLPPPAAPPKKSPELQALADKKEANRAKREALLLKLNKQLGSTANMGIDPAAVGLVVEIIDTYIDDGILTFKEVIQRFREEFGRRDDLDGYFEAGWELARGEEVTVAEAVTENDNDQTTSETDAGLDGTGQDPDLGGRASDDVRGDDDDSVLGTLPADADETTQGDGDVRAGDQEGEPRGGVSDAPDGVAGDGETHSGGNQSTATLPPSGDKGGFVGIKPPDYQLTDARIRAIIDRGNAERLADNIAAIQTIKAIRAENRYATPEEQEILAKYVGWGASEIVQFLETSPRYGWSKPQKALWKQLHDTITEEERSQLIRSAPNAHYTFDLYKPLWAALERAGFMGGRVLEPSVGSGHAIGFMSPEVRAASQLTAVELDPTTAAIAQALYPSMRTQPVGYEVSRIPRATQDLVVSNVPFGDFGVFDALMPKFITHRIHNYFFAKAMEHVRPGGLVVFVSTHRTMDGQAAGRVRKYLMDRAHFVGAVRLPGGAFADTAKTEVVTDLIVLQRFNDGDREARNADLFKAAPEKEEWRRTRREGRKDVEIKTYRSAWYEKHPDLILGREDLTGTMYSGGSGYNVEPTGPLGPQLEKALAKILTEGLYVPPTTQAAQDKPPALDPGTFKPGELRKDGKKKIVKVERDGSTTDITPKPKKDGSNPQLARLQGMIDVREALRATVAAMSSPTSTDVEILKTQVALSKTYNAFVKAHGNLNDRANVAAFKDDPESANLRGLEVVKPVSKEITRKDGSTVVRIVYEVQGLADIFEHRTIFAPTTVTHADNAGDALLASLGQSTRLDWDYMASITGQSVEDLQKALKAEGRLFEAPSGEWVIAEEYLSGDVVSKLLDAEHANDPKFAPNIEALKAIQPAPKTVEMIGTPEVSIRFGSNWIPAKHFQQFIADELFVAPGEITLAHEGTETYTRWTAEFTREAADAGISHPLAVLFKKDHRGEPQEIYGFTGLVSDALNLKTPDLSWSYKAADGSTITVKEPEATLAARANVDEINGRWTQWLIEHDDVAHELIQQYNHRFNRTVERTFDGSHLSLPGLALAFPDKDNPGKMKIGAKALYPHQLNVIWRILTTGNTLVAHEVGAGKTFEMIVAAMEMRRTGRARKPMITVPTNLLGQWRDDIMRAYPAAKVLAFDESDLSSDKRQRAMAKIAFGDWDFVLVPHSSFQLLRVSPQRVIDTLNEWIAELQAAEGEIRDREGKDSKSLKEMERARRKIEDKVKKQIAKLNKTDDNNLNFDQLGIDALFVDEAHAFKNLFYFTKIDNLRGLSRSESDRAIDMFVKSKDINEQSGYRNLVLATATPVMNSVAEIYTMQRYLQPQVLRQYGFENFDNWYAMFAQAAQVVEQNPDGTYREVRRLRDFSNLKLLYGLVARVMDYVGNDDMPYLVLPKVKGGKINVVKGEQHPLYDEIMRPWFTRRLAELKAKPPHIDRTTGEYVAPTRYHPITGDDMGRLDNILTVMNDARLAAIDMRLVLGNYVKDFPGSRINRVVADAYDEYKGMKKEKGVTLIFLDVGTPKKEDLKPLAFLKGVDVEDTTEGESLGTEDETLDDDESEDGAPPVLDDPAFFNLYDEIRDKLIKKGVKPEEIAYIHQARNAAERLALFDAVNTGKVRVLLASTEKGGVGMNVQKRLGAMLEMDVPRAMRPGDIRQRQGRPIRQGNSYTEVSLRRYVTEGSTDEWLYGLINTKDRNIREFMNGNATGFSEKDLSSLSNEEAQIHSTGDARGVELIELRESISRLSAQAEAADNAKGKARKELATLLPRIEHEKKDAKDLARALSHHDPIVGDAFLMTVGEADYKKRDEARAAIVAEMQRVARAGLEEAQPIAYAGGMRHVLGGIGGVPIQARYIHRQFYDHSIVLEADFTKWGLGVEQIYNEDLKRHDLEKSIKDIGEDRNPAAIVVNAYNALPAKLKFLEKQIAEREELARRSQQTIDRPNPARQKVQEAKARIADLEAQFKAEGEAKQAAAEAERKEMEKERAEREIAKKASYQSGDSEANVDVFTEEQATSGSAPAGIKQINPVEFPEMVAIAQDLTLDPEVAPKMAMAEKRGEFRHGGIAPGIRIAAGLFKRGMEIQLAKTIAHEIGHALDWLPHKHLKRGNLLGRLFSLHRHLKHTFTNDKGDEIKLKDVRRELVALSAAWRPWNRAEVEESYRKYRDSSKELYADAISALLTNPGLLEKMAPTFYQEFFDSLDRKPEARDAYFALQELLSGTREDLIQRRINRDLATIDTGNVKARDLQKLKEAERKAAGGDLWLRTKIQTIDKHMTFYDKKAEVLERKGRIPEESDPTYMLEERAYLGGKIKGWMARTMQPVYKLTQKTQIPWAHVGLVLQYERIINGDRSDLANPGGDSVASAQEKLDYLRQNYSADQLRALDQAVADFRRGFREVTELGYEAGLYTDEQYDNITKNPYYGTFQVIEHMDQGMTAAIIKQSGTLKGVVNVADATILKAMVTIRAAEHNKVKVAAFNFLHRHFADEIQQAREVFIPGKGLVPQEPEAKDRGKLVLITYKEKGRTRGKLVDPYVAASLNNESIGANNTFIAVLRMMNSKVFRPIFTTYNPGFMTFNIVRDFLRFWKNIPTMGMGRALVRYYQAVPIAKVRAFGLVDEDANLVRRTARVLTGKPATAPTPKEIQAWKDLVEAEENMIFSITFNDMVHGRESEDQQIEDIFVRSGIGDPMVQRHPLIRGLKAILDPIEQVGVFIETLPKAAAIHEYKGKGSISDITAAQRSSIRREVGSPDFLAGGTWKAVYNELFLFSTAISQSIRADTRVATQPTTRGGWWWKTAAINLAPKAFAAGIILLGLGGDDRKRAWQKISEYDLTNYLSFPIGKDENGNTVYVRLPQDDFGRLMGGMFWKGLQLTRGDRDVIEGLTQVFDYTQGQVPGLSPVLEPINSVKSFLTGRNPYDDFRGRNVFTDDEWAARYERKGETAKKFFGWQFQQLGGSIVWKFVPGETLPREQGGLENVLSFPVVSNVAGRWIKASSYGDIERLRAARAKVEGGEAAMRIRRREEVNKAIREYRSLQPWEQSIERQKTMAREIAKSLYPDLNLKDRTEKAITLEKTIKVSIRRGEADPYADQMLSASSNEQKKAIIMEAQDSMSAAEFQRWYDDLKKDKLISTNLDELVRKK